MCHENGATSVRKCATTRLHRCAKPSIGFGAAWLRANIGARKSGLRIHTKRGNERELGISSEQCFRTKGAK
jgi:hypothetical protein